MSEVFPAVFSNKPIFGRIVGEITRHHRYLTLFTAERGETGDKARILTGFQLLSVQTMLMFLLAWLYDVQAPDDDGSCEIHTSSSSCLARKTILDSSTPYCQWVKNEDYDPNASEGSKESMLRICEFSPFDTLTLRAMLYVAVIVALFVAVCSKPIDMIFDLLSAPTADELKISAQDTALKEDATKGV